MTPFESGIPLPAPPQHGGNRRCYPWKEMEVGDSFAYPGPITHARVNACRWAKKLGRKFTWGRHEGQLRVWRVE